MGPSQSNATSSSHKKVARERSVLLSQQHKAVFFSPGIFQGSGIAVEKKVQVCGQDLRPGEHTISSPATAPVCRMAEQPVQAGLLGKGEMVKEKGANQTLYFMKNA